MMAVCTLLQSATRQTLQHGFTTCTGEQQGFRSCYMPTAFWITGGQYGVLGITAGIWMRLLSAPTLKMILFTTS